jgi:hypothetical protein
MVASNQYPSQGYLKPQFEGSVRIGRCEYRVGCDRPGGRAEVTVRAMGLQRKPLLRRGWFVALLITAGVIAWGVALSFSGSGTLDTLAPPVPVPTPAAAATSRTSVPTGQAAPACGSLAGFSGPVHSGDPRVDRGWALRNYQLSKDLVGDFAATIEVTNEADSSRVGLFALTVTSAGKLCL